MGWWKRFFFEYVGNVSTEGERRRERQARILMDHIKDDLARRGLAPVERERIVEGLRKAVRAGEPERSS
ncbi:MAG: hypothetical protein ACREAA_21720 [Candidatus Polarisedimenticolia bacterium]